MANRVATETLHYHYGRDSYRIQYDITQIAEAAASESNSGMSMFRVSLIRAKMLGAGSPLRYFAYTRDFDTLPEARRSATEYSKMQVRQQSLKRIKKHNWDIEPP